MDTIQDAARLFVECFLRERDTALRDDRSPSPVWREGDQGGRDATAIGRDVAVSQSVPYGSIADGSVRPSFPILDLTYGFPGVLRTGCGAVW